MNAETNIPQAQGRTDDLHTLMAIAVLCGHRALPVDVSAVYAAWERAYPNDALGPIGRGLYKIGAGEPREGYAIIEAAARDCDTRTDQAREVLENLRRDMAGLVTTGGPGA